ncbi:hypothetical protein [Salicibibacter cibarius]|nr:hypothetical protein [Salicibibacter cibarius]
MLSEDQVQTLKKRLLQTKNELESQAEESYRPEETGELSQTGNHP